MAKLPNQVYRDWFEGEKADFPLGAIVRGNTQLEGRLAASKPGRRRDMAVQGVLVAYDDAQCRFLVYWHHPAYADLKPDAVPLEPLAPNHLELVPVEDQDG